MSIPNPIVKSGTKMTPPPKPVSDPRKPANRAPAKSTNSKEVITGKYASRNNFRLKIQNFGSIFLFISRLSLKIIMVLNDYLRFTMTQLNSAKVHTTNDVQQSKDITGDINKI